MAKSPRAFRPYPGDENLIVTFYMDDMKDEYATRETGIATYRDVEMVRIVVPGNNNTIVAPASSLCAMPSMDGEQGQQSIAYVDRFPEEYERFKLGKGTAIKGMPLKHVPWLSKAEISTLEAQNVYSVEQLADMGGEPLRNLGMRGRQWQQQAKEYLRAAVENRDVVAFAAEKAELLAQIEELKAGNRALQECATPDEAAEKAELKDKIEQLTGARPRGTPSVETLQKMLAEAQG